jgi:AraC family transcriptional activator of pobA
VGKAVPFAIEPADVIRLTSIYQQIMEECYGGKPDRFDLITTYLQTLLFQVRRLYDKAAASSDEPAKPAAGSADEALVGRFRALLERTLHHEGAPRHRTAAHYARELGVPMRALDEAIRRVTGRTAHALLHDHLLLTAKALLVQTSLSIKEIAYQLDFNEPAHFTNFFKKYTRQTPAQFRKQEHA